MKDNGLISKYRSAIDEDGYLTKEAYDKIQYENLGVYSTPTEAQKAIVKLNNYFEKNSHKI